VGHNEQIFGAACYFPYNFLKFTDQSFFSSSKGNDFLCKINMITSHSNQPFSSIRWL